jgi:hypothetical protein
MITNMYCIHDSKAQAYLPPFFFHRDGQATRVFANCVNNEEHTFAINPADYTLFKVGSFDDSNALIKVNQSNTPISLGNGVEFLGNQQTESENAQISDATQLRENTDS